MCIRDRLSITRLNKNQGAANARNIGSLQANSKYIAFLDSDDIWHPQKLELQYRLMQENQALLSFHRYRHDISLPTDEKAFFNTVYHDTKFTKLNRRKFIVTNPIATPTVMARREVFKPFNTNLKRMEDYECWVRNSKHAEFLFIDADLAAGYKPPIGHAGLSANVPAMHADLLTALKMLYKNQDIDVNFFISAYLLECLKYPIRLRRAKP